MRAALVLAVAVVGLGAGGGASIAIDRSFGTDGHVLRSIGAGSDPAQAVTRDHQGRIVVAGYTGYGLAFHNSGHDYARIYVARFLPQGRLDRSFGRFGIVTLDPGVMNDVVTGVAVQRDSKIVVAGSTTALTENASPSRSGIWAYRLMPDGRVDRGYGRKGMALRTLPEGTQAFPGFSGIASGVSTTVGAATIRNPGDAREVALVRFDSHGHADPTFGRGGLVAVEGVHEPRGMIAQRENGRLIIFGASDYPDIDFMLIRLLPDGRPDPSFGTRGLAQISFGTNYDVALAVAERPDKTLFVAGLSYIPEGRVCAGQCQFLQLASLRANGDPDPRFGGDGTVEGGLQVSGNSMAVVPRSGGRFVVGTAVNFLTPDEATAGVPVDRGGNVGRIAVVNMTSGRKYGTEHVAAAVSRPGGVILAGGASKPTLGEGRLIIYDLSLVALKVPGA